MPPEVAGSGLTGPYMKGAERTKTFRRADWKKYVARILTERRS